MGWRKPERGQRAGAWPITGGAGDDPAAIVTFTEAGTLQVFAAPAASLSHAL